MIKLLMTGDYMSDGYFCDKIDALGQWHYTAIHVAKGAKPYYQLLTGGAQRRFMLSGQDYCYYAGTISYDYYETYLLYNPQKPMQYSPISPIGSADVEHYKAIGERGAVDYWRYWANFFAKMLIDTPYGMLSAGEWRIVPILPIKPQKSTPFTMSLSGHDYWKAYGKMGKYYPLSSMAVSYYDLDKTLLDMAGVQEYNRERYRNLLFYAGHLPHADDGRVKWWRKKIREQSCPPLLVWWQSWLQGYFLLDGYARLQAYLLENVAPDVLAITPVQTQYYPVPEKTRLQILASLDNTLAKAPKGQGLSQQHINELLIRAYDDGESIDDRGSGKMIHNLDTLWDKKVQDFAQDSGVVQGELGFLYGEM